ncbi:protein of unknown function [Modestobacter italicus]|uniref:Uncharacterized protein n=1 Tax=Modestobacter italicus (strain DSM 44449 / CECT 9708 / BC 501) TaxID=2732864 RepID=I4EQY1_MODI5|nr:hypothetical protein [Modestobacter marinus]CCH85794.1 protein of unknown function [Modestobacter marinus]
MAEWLAAAFGVLLIVVAALAGVQPGVIAIGAVAVVIAVAAFFIRSRKSTR